METKELDKLAEELDASEVRYIMNKQLDNISNETKLRIEKQVPSKEEIISEYSIKGYVQHDIEGMNGQKLTLRSLNPWQEEDSIRKAKLEAKGDGDIYGRSLFRWRLAHSLIAINGRNYAGQMVGDSPYSSIAPADLKKMLDEAAQRRYEALEMDGLANMISQFLAIWDEIVFNRINGFKDLSQVLGN